MLLILILLPIVSAYNIDTAKYTVLDGRSGEFGYSLATSSERLFVGAPKDNKQRGALYTCKLEGMYLLSLSSKFDEIGNDKASLLRMLTLNLRSKIKMKFMKSFFRFEERIVNTNSRQNG